MMLLIHAENFKKDPMGILTTFVGGKTVVMGLLVQQETLGLMESLVMMEVLEKEDCLGKTEKMELQVFTTFKCSELFHC